MRLMTLKPIKEIIENDLCQNRLKSLLKFLHLLRNEKDIQITEMNAGIVEEAIAEAEAEVPEEGEVLVHEILQTRETQEAAWMSLVVICSHCDKKVVLRKKITLISIQREKTKAWQRERVLATERPRLESQLKGRASPQSTEAHQGGEASHLIKGDVEAGRGIEGTPDHPTDVEAAHVTEGILDHPIDAGRRITEEALQETQEIVDIGAAVVIVIETEEGTTEEGIGTEKGSMTEGTRAEIDMIGPSLHPEIRMCL